MKTKFLVYGVLAIFLALSFVTCEEVSDVVHSDLLGTWNLKSNTASYASVIVISEEEIEVLNELGTSQYVAKIIEANPVTNSGGNSQGFPEGFKFTTSIIDSNSTGNPEGASRDFTIYLSRDSRSFLMGSAEYIKARNVNTPNEQGVSITDYYETWVDDAAPNYNLKISATELVETEGTAVRKYKFIRVSDAENIGTNKATYPSGFNFVFEMTESATAADVGKRYLFSFFMNPNDKTKIEEVYYKANGDYDESFFYTKQ